jgi:hypothetical protein
MLSPAKMRNVPTLTGLIYCTYLLKTSTGEASDSAPKDGEGREDSSRRGKITAKEW